MVNSGDVTKKPSICKRRSHSHLSSTEQNTIQTYAEEALLAHSSTVDILKKILRYFEEVDKDGSLLVSCNL
jgi:hypothetical protein